MRSILLAFSFCSLFVFQSCLRDNEDPVPVSPYNGIVMNVDSVGGASEPNQVWVRLENSEITSSKRTIWDLGFYSGNEFKVVLNNSIFMAAGKIENVSDINAVNSTMVAALKEKVQVANFDPTNVPYIDDVKGNFPTGYTAISEISANESENAVYLINMGRKLYEEVIPAGSVIPGGESRGWKKLQIIRSGNNYKLRFADLDSTTHTEVIIEKNPTYNFTFYSMTDAKVVDVQPEKNKWDICFTVFTNIIPGAGSYIYSDFVTTNIMGGSSSYMVSVPAGTNVTEFYDNFSAANVDASLFATTDQRSIGGNWRLVGPSGANLYGDRFFVVRDHEGHFYKLKFTRMSNLQGERGRPEFEYKPL